MHIKRAGMTVGFLITFTGQDNKLCGFSDSNFFQDSQSIQVGYGWNPKPLYKES